MRQENAALDLLKQFTLISRVLLWFLSTKWYLYLDIISLLWLFAYATVVVQRNKNVVKRDDIIQEIHLSLLNDYEGKNCHNIILFQFSFNRRC